MKSIIRYWRVYQGYFSTSLTEDMSFRTNFFLIAIMDLFFYFSTFASVSIIYDHVETIGPWNKDQLMFFVAFVLCINHLHMSLLSHNFWELPEQIKTGQLDYVLLRPVSSLFEVFFRRVRTSALLNTPFIWGTTIYYGNQLELGWSSWLLLIPLVLLSMTLLALIEFLIATSMFWLQEGMGINFLRMQLQQLSRWPHFIYSEIPRRLLLFLVPVLLVGSAPTTFLFNKQHWQLMLYLLLAIIILFFLLRWLWSRALESYESASS